jgi:phosphoglycolate phosphatase-like HAD superfamily hydrolase
LFMSRRMRSRALPVYSTSGGYLLWVKTQTQYDVCSTSLAGCTRGEFLISSAYDMLDIGAALFDLDDTLLKTAEVKWAHHRAVAAQYGITLTDETLARYWGMPFDQMIGYLYNHADTLENMRAANRALEARFPKAIHDDAIATLTRLALCGIVSGVVTSTTSEYAAADLARVHVPADTFLFVQGADITPYHKPDGRVFDPALARLAELGIQRSHVLYVGDAIMDHEAATSAGIEFLGVATGFVSIDQFQGRGAQAISRLGELPAYLGLDG